MNQVFLIGVHPGLATEMLDFIANTMIEFATSACEHLKVL